MNSSFKQIKNDLIFGLIKGLIILVERMRRDLALKLATMLGEIAAILDGKERRLAEANLRRVYGSSWDDIQIKLVARECFVMISKNIADVIRSRNWSPQQLEKMVDVEGIENYDQAKSKGKGVVAVTGHIGNFELLAAWFSAVKKVPVSVIGRKLYDERLDDLVVEHREKWGMENIPSDAPARRFLDALKQGRTIGVLMDLDSSKIAGYFIPFFGIPAKTAAGPVFIARRAESPLLPVALYRTENDRFLLKVWPMFEASVTDNKEDDIKSALLRCNKAIEEMINYDPTQWAWIHNRWKSKPSSAENVKGILEEVV